MSPELWKHTQLPEVELLYYPRLEQTGMVKHCFTTRRGGVSQGIFSSMNLSFTRGDDEEAVRENFRRVAKAMDVEYEQIVCSDQTHTTCVRRVTQEDAGCGLVRERTYHEVDGLITNVPGITLATFYADCVPLYFVDTRHRAIGLSHSGWRGTVQRMARETLQAMHTAYGTEPEDVLCAIGPSICRSCSEVGEDVAVRFREGFGEKIDRMLFSKSNGRYRLDLWEANVCALREAGVPAEQIIRPNLCTCCNDRLLFSHRASQGKRGNLAAFLCIV